MPWRRARLRALYAPFLAPGRLGFDLGAHVGNRIAAWRALGARVVAAEPQADCLHVLRRLYGADPAVSIEAVAVGRECGKAPLFVDPRNLAVSTLSQSWVERRKAQRDLGRRDWHDAGEVEVVTLEALIARHGEPDFVKIDVEGAELDVLAGLQRPLRALSFEYLAADSGAACDCLAQLESLGAYEFNASPGESLRLLADRWVSAHALRQWLAALRIDAGSGDIYARRIEGAQQ
jgi:FkbM family methyltransferase